MIFLIAPYQERLCIIVVDASSSGPETARIGSLQTTNCKKYFIAQKNQLLVLLHLLSAAISGMGLDLLAGNDANAPQRASSS